MANTQSTRCQRASSVSEPETKPGVDDEHISPDMIHIFREDKADAPAGPLTPPTSPPPPAKARVVPARSDQGQTPWHFPQFKRLPPEIRYLIWEAAVPEPTVVPRTWSNAKFRYKLRRGAPAVLQACAESRALLVAQQPHQPGAAGGGVAPRFELVRMPGREDEEGVYMDFDRDSIWIYRGYEISDAELAAYSGLRSLVMNWGLRPCWVESAVDEGVKFVRKFPGLRLLTLLVDFNEHGWPEPSTLKGLRRLRRSEVKRIWALVRAALRRAEDEDPEWTAPQLHIVHRTEEWCRREAR
ncbi:hypothetical protein DHEL01_v209830 [Diaporthe helianthi]|uniref:2EXR domain-containing protein n=1 Tax=Diaporthe helianthi TaxID=158607 RepID=A0A2P5HND9_DIAHE|nr:hypothetical protein DHEL01_v209830 [Diaporthe helianthi]